MKFIVNTSTRRQWKLYFKICEVVPGAQLGGGEGGEVSLAFFENQKKCPDFAKRGPDCAHP